MRKNTVYILQLHREDIKILTILENHFLGGGWPPVKQKKWTNTCIT